MFYKIVGVSDQRPDDPIVYTGEVRGEPNDHPLLAALACEFGDRDGKPAVDQLLEWSGGESKDWAANVGSEESEMTVACDDATFHVFVSETPFAGTVPTPGDDGWTVGQIRKAIGGLPDDTPLRMFMLDGPDNFSVTFDSLAPSKDRKSLEMHVSILDDEDLDEEDDDDVE